MDGVGNSGLDALFHPRSIAIVGASPDSSKISGRPLTFLKRHGYPGEIFLVNPNQTEIAGHPVVPKVRELPGPVDVALIVTPARFTMALLEECAEVGVRSAIVCAGGFAEFDQEGARTEARMGELAATSGLRILGPNCQGLVHPAERLCATFNAAFLMVNELTSGPVAWVGQSGAVGGAAFDVLRNAGLSVVTWVSTGNQADIDVTEVADYQLRDPRTKVVAGYIEGIRDVDRFRSMARLARSLGKAVILIKGGRTPAGEQATLTHTGVMSGEDDAYAALMREEGVTFATGLNDLVGAVVTSLTATGPVRGKAVIMGNSGGMNAMIADECYRRRLDVEPLPSRTTNAVRALLPEFIQPNNPIDFQWTIFTDPGRVEQLVDVLVEEGKYDTYFVVLHSIHGEAGYRVDDLMDSLDRCMRRIEGLLVVVLMNRDTAVASAARSRGIAVFEDIEGAVRAAAARLPSPPWWRARRTAGRSGERRLLAESEHKAKAVLHQAGIAIPPGGLAVDAEEAASLAERLGFPLVVKAQARDLPHKSEAGAVAMGLRSVDEVRRAFDHVVRAARDAGAQGIEGVLVEREVSGVVAEVILGIRRVDPLGVLATMGLGGVLTEIYADTVSGLLPLDQAGAESMIRDIRAYPLLDGYRGRPPGDLAALAAVIVEAGNLALRRSESLEELELNPIAVLPKGEGVVVLDALVVPPPAAIG
jgi:acyl-CoA synthetase (NDP forming)